MAQQQDASSRRLGLLYLLATAIGWGFNWPALKVLLAEWPALFSRGVAGCTAALILAAIALARGERLAVPRAAMPRLVGRWRFQIILRGRDTARFRAWLTAVRGLIFAPGRNNVRVITDVDPRSLL